MGPQRHGRRVVVLGEMGQAGPLQTLEAAFCRSSAASTFEMWPAGPRIRSWSHRIRTVGQHVGDRSCSPTARRRANGARPPGREDVPQIGQDAEAAAAVVDDEGHAVDAVVRGANGLDRDVVETQGFAAAKVPQVGDFSQPVAAAALKVSAVT